MVDQGVLLVVLLAAGLLVTVVVPTELSVVGTPLTVVGEVGSVVSDAIVV